MNGKVSKLVILIIVGVILLLSNKASVFAQDEAVDKGVDWLRTNQSDDGSWGKQLDLEASGFAIVALERAGQDVLQDKNHLEAQTYDTSHNLVLQLLATRSQSVKSKLLLLQKANGSQESMSKLKCQKGLSFGF